MDEGTRWALLGTAGLAATVGAGLAIQRNRAHQAQLLAADRQPWRDLPSTITELITPDDAHLIALQSGDPSGPTVVLAHCWTGSRYTWAPVARRLADQGMNVIRWEQRGHGQSTAGTAPNTVRTLANDLSLVLQTYDVQDAVLVGHSLGGMTSMGHAMYHWEEFGDRFRGLVLVDTAAAGLDNPISRLGPTATSQQWVDNLADRPGFGRMIVRPTFGTWAAPDHIKQAAHDFTHTSLKVRSDIAAEFPRLDLRPGLDRIHVPTKIYVGSMDILTPVHLGRSMAQAIPDSELAVLPSRGHMGPFESPNEVTAGIIDLADR